MTRLVSTPAVAGWLFTAVFATAFAGDDLPVKRNRTPQEDVHLFILSGQSNMQGHRPDEAFTPAVEGAFGAKNLVVVQHALGGQLRTEKFVQIGRPTPPVTHDEDRILHQRGFKNPTSITQLAGQPHRRVEDGQPAGCAQAA